LGYPRVVFLVRWGFNGFEDIGQPKNPKKYEEMLLIFGELFSKTGLIFFPFSLGG